MTFPYLIENERTFRIGDIEFHIDDRPDDQHPSRPGRFTIIKTRPYLDFYGELARSMHARTILELGIFQGGSFVMLDKLFRPDRIAALDIRSEPVAPLVEYASGLQNRYVNFGVSQDDEIQVRHIVEQQLGGGVDLVVDDASHQYAPTRASFTAIFPLLSPGGVYVIEDWAWAHRLRIPPEWADNIPLTNLIFDLVALQGSSTWISEIRIFKPFCFLRKASVAVQVPADFWSAVRAGTRPPNRPYFLVRPD